MLINSYPYKAAISINSFPLASVTFFPSPQHRFPNASSFILLTFRFLVCATVDVMFVVDYKHRQYIPALSILTLDTFLADSLLTTLLYSLSSRWFSILFIARPFQFPSLRFSFYHQFIPICSTSTSVATFPLHIIYCIVAIY